MVDDVRSGRVPATPLVALGGSAGSLSSILHFFSVMPSEPGLAFVVAVHLSPDQESLLPDLIQRRSRLHVHLAENNQRIEPNHVYVIPPGQVIQVLGERLAISRVVPERGVRTALDVLFTSVAEHYRARSAAVLFSGADSDGALGVQRIKLSDGRTFVQDPDEAQQPAMPKAAIATGCVDTILPAEAIPARVLHLFGCPPAVEPARLRMDFPERKKPTRQEEAFIHEVLARVRERTGRDISAYRPSGILRHLERRMRLRRCGEPEDYLDLLGSDASEPEALAQDLLVSITRFFRDPLAFAELARLVPRLFEGKGPDDFVRVWTPACATGEEAYSVAILLLEHAGALPSPPTVQIFAGDLDAKAIEIARFGAYPDKSVESIEDDRLLRFFSKEKRGYRVCRRLRQTVLFSVQDALRDPPLARIDLITCRNLLIYLSPEAQKRVLGRFHFALRERGLLFLGPAESLQPEHPLFETVDPRHHLYSRRPGKAVVGQVGDASSILKAIEYGRPAPIPLAPDFALARDDEGGTQELRAIVQQLRATGEELEVSRQELQSMNEELSIVNQALSVNIDDLNRANNDLRNLIDATAIPTIFLDRNLCIMRYTPPALEIFGLIPRDVGRPLVQLRAKLDYPTLHDDVLRVLETSARIEREVRSLKGSWYHARIVPYQTAGGESSGVVLTFLDVTQRKNAEEGLARELECTRVLSRLSARLVTEEKIQAIYEEVLTAAIEITRADAGMVQMLDERNEQLAALATRGFSRRTEEVFHRLDAGSGASCPEVLRTGARLFLDFDPTSREPSHLGYVEDGILSAQSSPLVSRSGKILGVVSTHWRKAGHRPSERDLRFLDLLSRQAADLIERDQSRAALRASEEAARTLFESIDEGFCLIEVLFDADGKAVDYVFLKTNAAFERQTGIKSAVGRRISEIAPHHEAHWFKIYGDIALTGVPLRFENPAAELDRWFDVYAFRFGDPKLRQVGVLFNDIRERKGAEAVLLASEVRLTAELADTRRLQRLTNDLIDEENGEVFYAKILDAAMEITGSDMGSIQELVPELEKLRLMGHRGFHPESAEFFEWVTADASTNCGRVLQRGGRSVLADVEKAEFLQGTEALRYLRLSHIRAVQTTPLVSRSGKILGMFSNHWKEPHEPSEQKLAFLNILARQVADLIERKQAKAALRARAGRLQ